jgi:hypothetical protein
MRPRKKELSDPGEVVSSAACTKTKEMSGKGSMLEASRGRCER